MVNDQAEERGKVRTEREALGDDCYNEGIRRSERIRKNCRNSSSSDNSSSNSDDENEKNDKVDGDDFKSYDLIVPSAKENKFSVDYIKLALSEIKN
jgi:hypothetical protein